MSSRIPISPDEFVALYERACANPSREAFQDLHFALLSVEYQVLADRSGWQPSEPPSIILDYALCGHPGCKADWRTELINIATSTSQFPNWRCIEHLPKRDSGILPPGMPPSSEVLRQKAVEMSKRWSDFLAAADGAREPAA